MPGHVSGDGSSRVCGSSSFDIEPPLPSGSAHSKGVLSECSFAEVKGHIISSGHYTRRAQTSVASGQVLHLNAAEQSMPLTARKSRYKIQWSTVE